MSFANPTCVHVGMRGKFGGKDYQVVGRSVMGESESGETYYWNEFNLETSSGEEATLVFEQTDAGGQWRLFTLFDPEYPMTAADAATKSVGDRINLAGGEVRVTFRGSSKVYYVEGRAPEGEDVGKSAEYFNAGSGSVMQVVSWTGDEVEYYNGLTLTRGLVASAFGLPPESLVGEGSRTFSSLSGGGSDSARYTSGLKFALQAAFVLTLFFVIFGRGFSCSRDRESSPPAKIPAGAPPLAVGATGTLFDKDYRVTAHAVVEVAEVGSKWERHEYELTDDYGTKWLLICGERPGAGEWDFFEPLSPMQAPTAKEAAAKKIGELVELDGYTGRVSEIFLSTVELTDGTESGGLRNGAMSYGIGSTSENRTLLARWDAAGIKFFRGRTMTAKQGAASFTNPK